MQPGTACTVRVPLRATAFALQPGERLVVVENRHDLRARYGLNGIRVAGTGVAAAYVGPDAATGFLHTFSGWLMFVLAFGLLLAVQQLIFRFFPVPVGPRSEVAP